MTDAESHHAASAAEPRRTAALRERIADAMRRGSQIVWVVGAPGSGRSDILQRLAQDDGSVLISCSRWERDVPRSALDLVAPGLGAAPGSWGAAPGSWGAELGVARLLIDDAAWCDDESWSEIRTAASAGLHVIATVDRLGPRFRSGDGEVPVAAPDVGEARSILTAITPGLAPGEVERVIAEAEGNLLGLVETAHHGRAETGRSATPLLEADVAVMLDECSPAANDALQVLTVADWTGDGVPRTDLAAVLAPSATAELEERGLVESRGSALRVTHPAVRRVVERHRSSMRTQAIARQLSESASGIDRLWFRAVAAEEEDPALAADLAASALLRLADAPSLAATILRRAAALDSVREPEFCVLAAEAHMEAHEPLAVPALLARARSAGLDEELTARSALIDAVRELASGDVVVARQLLIVALRAFPSGHSKRPRAISIASEIALWFGRTDWADELVSTTHPEEPGVATALLVRRALTRGIVDAAGDGLPPSDADDPILEGITAVLALDDVASADACRRLAEVAPESLTAQVTQALATWHRGDVARAPADIDAPWVLALQAAGAALRAADRGDDSRTQTLAESAIRLSLIADFPLAGALARWALAKRLIQEGQPPAAVRLLDTVLQAGDAHHLVVGALAAPDHLEALARSGDRVRLAELRALVPRTPRAESWAAIAYGRSLAYADADTEGGLANAIGAAKRTGRTLEEARGRLLRGELLRRERRRLDAREELREAVTLFEMRDASGWLRRAARELEATVEIVKQDAGRSPLTPRQQQIAELVTEGASNQEIAARLGMSRKTVEHHLHNAYGVLGIRSRLQIAEALSALRTDDGDASAPSD